MVVPSIAIAFRVEHIGFPLSNLARKSGKLALFLIDKLKNSGYSKAMNEQLVLMGKVEAKRRKYGWRGSDMAERLGVSPAAYSKAKNGKRRISAILLVSIANELPGLRGEALALAKAMRQERNGHK